VGYGLSLGGLDGLGFGSLPCRLGGGARPARGRAAASSAIGGTSKLA
jgi:hypothetical protein